MRRGKRKDEHPSNAINAAKHEPLVKPRMTIMRNALTLLLVAASHLAAWSAPTARAMEYPYAPYNEGKMDPQKTGWPLTDAERAYVLKPEYERRPGREVNQHKPAMWPVTPSAGFWGGTSWLDTHAKLVEYVQANPGPSTSCSSATASRSSGAARSTRACSMKRGRSISATTRPSTSASAATRHRTFSGGSITAASRGFSRAPSLVMIGNNNMFFTPETGIEPAAKGIQMVVANVREKFPQAAVIVAKILPAHAPGNRFYEDIKKTNLALDPLKLDSDPKVRVLDLTATSPTPTARSRRRSSPPTTSISRPRAMACMQSG